MQTFILLAYYEYKNEIHLYTEVSLPSTLSPTKQVRKCIVVNNRGSLLYTKHQFVIHLAVFRCLMGHLHQLDYSGNRNFSKAWSLKQLAINTYVHGMYVLSKSDKCTCKCESTKETMHFLLWSTFLITDMLITKVYSLQLFHLMQYSSSTILVSCYT